MISNFGLFPPLSSFFIGTTIQCECLDWIELAVLLFLIKFRSLQILKNFPFLAANITGINCVQIIMWVPHTYYHPHIIKGCLSLQGTWKIFSRLRRASALFCWCLCELSLKSIRLLQAPWWSQTWCQMAFFTQVSTFVANVECFFAPKGAPKNIWHWPIPLLLFPYKYHRRPQNDPQKDPLSKKKLPPFNKKRCYPPGLH